MRLSEGKVSEFQKEKASEALPTNFPTMDEKDDVHRIMTEVEPLMGASGHRTRRNILMTHGEYPCHCLADVMVPQTRQSGVIVGRQNQPVSIVVVSAMLAVRWLEANAGTSEQATVVPTPEQLTNVKMNNNLDLFRTTCKVLRTPKAIERIWSRQRLMPWFRTVMTSWIYERAKLDIGPGACKRAFLTHRNAVTTALKRVAGAPCVTQSFQLDIGPGAYKRAFLTHRNAVTTALKRVAGAPCVTQSFQLDIGPGAYKRAFLTHRNAVTTALKRVAGAPCVTEAEKKEVLQADLERLVSLCLHNSFCRNREQKVNVDLLPCCKPRLKEQESWDTARNSVDMVEKVLEDRETEEQGQEAME